MTKALRELRAQVWGTKKCADCGDHRFAVGHDGAKRGRCRYDVGKKIKGLKRYIAVDRAC
jgi:TnpA family transposase